MRGFVPAVLVASSLTVLPVALLKAGPQAPARAKPPLTALDRYVAAPDSNFTWKAVRDLPAEGVTATLIDMTSQRWLTEKEVERPLWTHWLTVIRPQTVTSDIACSSSPAGPRSRSAGEAPRLARRRGARDGNRNGGAAAGTEPAGGVHGRPDACRAVEDDFIAYTWNKFLTHRRRTMAGAVADDQECGPRDGRGNRVHASPAGGGHAAARFVVSGASKRGWTTWATAAVDTRVIAIAPAVIDLLNIEPSFMHHFRHTARGPTR